MGGGSPIALLSTGEILQPALNMQTLQEKAGIEFADIELLRLPEQVIFCQNGSRKQENTQNTACYGQISHEHKLCL